MKRALKIIQEPTLFPPDKDIGLACYALFQALDLYDTTLSDLEEEDSINKPTLMKVVIARRSKVLKPFFILEDTWKKIFFYFDGDPMYDT